MFGELLTGPGWIADAGGLIVRLYQRPGTSGTGCRIAPPPEAAIAVDIPSVCAAPSYGSTPHSW